MLNLHHFNENLNFYVLQFFNLSHFKLILHLYLFNNITYVRKVWAFFCYF